MKIVKSIYVETVEILVLGSSRWRKQGLEAEVEEGEDVVAASKELKKMVDEIHRQNNVDVDTFERVMAPPVKPDPMLARMKILIDSATTKKEMDGYSARCPKELTEYFSAKLKKLKK